jgi:DNA-binding response OmpR family regulator
MAGAIDSDDFVEQPPVVRAATLRPPMGTDFRNGTSFPLPPTVRCGDLELDRAGRRAVLAGRDLELTEREFALLTFLADRADHAVQRAELLSRIWILHDEAEPNIVNVYVRRLRQKLGARAGMIRTIRGFGYCLRSERVAWP